MQNTSYLKLLKLSLVVLLAMLFINYGIKNTSYAYNINQYVNILAHNSSSLPTQTRSNTQWFLRNFIYSKDWFVFDENNDLIVMCPSYSSNVGYEYDIYYINLNGHKFAWGNDTKPRINFNGSVRVHRFDFYTKTGTTYTQLYNTTYNTKGITLNRADGNNFNYVVIVGSSLMQNSSYTGTTEQTYYFKQVFDVAPQFVKNNDGVLNYREQSKKLGYIDNFTTADDVNFLLVDPNSLYDSIVATVGDGIILVEDRVYIDTRKIRSEKIYDLYFYYNNELNEIYQYYWYYESGDSGYELIDSTYDIIDNNKQNTEEIINNQNQNSDNIVNAIESGEKENQNFIQQKVNEIFGINSGDLNESLNNFINNINLPSGELEIDKSILGIITEDAGDFVISWQTMETPFLTISGESINFSALCRNNEDMAKLKEWLNIILSLFAFRSINNKLLE